MSRQCIFLYVGLLLWCLGVTLAPTAHAAEMRTWASDCGATLEARYLTLEQGMIMLESPEGRRMGIEPERLSEADQQYVLERLGVDAKTSVDPETAEAAPVDSRTIPGLTLVDENGARMIGLQTGESADRVVYLIFERSEGTYPCDVLHVYDPSAQGPARLQTPGSRSRRDDGGNPYHEFDTLEYEVRYGAVPARHRVTLSSGAVRSDLIWMRVESEYGTGRDIHRVTYAGTLNDDVRTGHGDIPTLPLAMEFAVSVRARAGDKPPFSGTIAAHPFVLTGPRRTLDTVSVDAVDADGNLVESGRVTVRDVPSFPTARGHFFRVDFRRLRDGETYTLIPNADLGPVIRVTQQRQRYTP